MIILFATDGSPSAEAAAGMLFMLPLPPETRIIALTVVPETPRSDSLHHPDAWDKIAEQLRREAIDAGTDLLNRTKESLLANNLDSRVVLVQTTVIEGDAAKEIASAATAFDVDLTIVGSRGLSGIISILLGSVARRVVENATCSVLVARPVTRGLKRVLLAVDGSQHSREAIRTLTRFPLPADTEVMVLSVARPIRLQLSELLPMFRPKIRRDIAEVERAEIEIARKLAEEAKSRLEAAGRKARALAVRGDPAETIIRLAGEIEADLVVIGSRGITGAKLFLLGSVAQKVIEHASCSVLVVKRRVSSERDERGSHNGV